jgi:acyl carrier protein phosphodiesterase
MNYLAHAYLSFNQPGILVGNMISDFVKGKTKFNYPHEIQNGISLHRAIDEFTDVHPATKKAKEVFRPAYRLYSGAFIDVVYDHFLALDHTEFKDTDDLKVFSLQVYDILEKNYAVLPPAFQAVFPYMKQHNWLFNYQYPVGIERSFGGLVRRAAYLDESDTAFALFNTNYNELQDCYSMFFPSVKKLASQYISNLLLP